MNRTNIRWLLLLGVCVFIVACAESMREENQSQINNASWNESQQIFSLSGSATNSESFVSPTDQQTGIAIGSTRVDKNNQWKIDLYNPAIVPCNVTLGNASKAVSNAPDNCGATRVKPVAIQFDENQILDRTLPDSQIIEPANDTTIIAGSSVEFKGLSSITSAKFLWTFAGAAEDINVQNPGKITFNNIGSFRIKLTTVDSHNIVDPIPAERIITVLPNDSQKRALNGVPVADIASPSFDRSLQVGDSLFFAAASAPAGEVYQYEWDFAGAASATNLQVPGVITFNTTGVFQISLNVIDALGVRSTLADTRVITVGDVVGANQAPTGVIREPLTDMTIVVGDTVNFLGAVVDVDNNGPYAFLWQFSGAAGDSSLLNPGIVKFSQAGIYEISFTATDGAGLADPNPPMRIITVNEVGAVNNDMPESTIVSPPGDISILVGESVDFVGLGESLAGNTPLVFEWSFDGVAPVSDLESPGLIPFDMPGVYTITFTVTDSLGQADPTPAAVVVTVNDPTPAPTPMPDPAAAPDGVILTPAGDMTIAVGESLDFTGEGTSPVGAEPLTYYWEFDDAMPEESMEQNPGPILFNHADVYEIELKVIDANGVEDPTPAKLIITVEDPTPPSGTIVMPEGDVTIFAGDTVDFNGTGVSPIGMEPLSYLWTFDGAAPDFMDVMPGPVTFDMPGVYVVTFTVTDAAGVADPNPPSVVVKVRSPDAPMGEITMPTSDVSIIQGEAIDFVGIGTSPTGAEPLIYLWDFDDGAPDSMEAAPGPVIFDIPGVFKVEFIVIDANGVVDSMPPSVIVTVEPTPPVADPAPAAGPVAVAVPSGEIESPKGSSVTINAGDSIDFRGEGDHVDPLTATYVWDFSGAIPNVIGLNPGLVTFDMPGVYLVTFTVSNEEGVTDPNPPSVEIVVLEPVPVPVP